jgi:hypothetical protein
VGRCNAAEQALAQRDKQLREQQSAVKDHQRWIERCLAAEQAYGRLAAERPGWETRWSAAENALSRNERLSALKPNRRCMSATCLASAMPKPPFWRRS